MNARYPHGHWACTREWKQTKMKILLLQIQANVVLRNVAYIILTKCFQCCPSTFFFISTSSYSLKTCQMSDCAWLFVTLWWTGAGPVYILVVKKEENSKQYDSTVNNTGQAISFAAVGLYHFEILMSSVRTEAYLSSESRAPVKDRSPRKPLEMWCQLN